MLNWNENASESEVQSGYNSPKKRCVLSVANIWRSNSVLWIDSVKFLCQVSWSLLILLNSQNLKGMYSQNYGWKNTKNISIFYAHLLFCFHIIESIFTYELNQAKNGPKIHRSKIFVFFWSNRYWNICMVQLKCEKNYLYHGHKTHEKSIFVLFSINSFECIQFCFLLHYHCHTIGIILRVIRFLWETFLLPIKMILNWN